MAEAMRAIISPQPSEYLGSADSLCAVYLTAGVGEQTAGG